MYYLAIQNAKTVVKRAANSKSPIFECTVLLINVFSRFIANQLEKMQSVSTFNFCQSIASQHFRKLVYDTISEINYYFITMISAISSGKSMAAILFQ